MNETFEKGNSPSVLSTMLGGSAPSQPPGAPFRTGSDTRATVWPPPAHQGDLFNRGYGIYSLFPGPGDTAKTLYTPTAKTTHSASPFQDFIGTQKVADTFFSNKFSFGANGTAQFNSISNPSVDRGISRLELMTKSYGQEPKPYSSTGKKSEKQDVSVRKESKPKRLSDDVVIIKSEVEEVNKTQNEEEGGGSEGREGKNDGGRERKFDEGKNGILSRDNESTVGAESVLSNEPDSTDFENSNLTTKEGQRAEDITTAEAENSESYGNTRHGVNGIRSLDQEFWKKHSENDERDENEGVNEKCNIKVIDLSVDGNGKFNNKKRAEKFPARVESINDICTRLTEKKDLKPKTPDSSCKNLTVNCKQFNNEPSKPSPTRTLSLPPHNGGCSRTTPVTFRHSSPHEPDPKPQSMSVDVPSLVIKKEPLDFQKYTGGGPFHSPTPLGNFYSPSGLRVLDGQLLSPVPYSDSYESSNGRKESFLSPRLDHNFLSPSQPFLSPRPMPENPFLSPNVDLGEFSAYKNYQTLPPKMGEPFLMNRDVQKIPQENFAESRNCLTSKEEGRNLDSSIFVNSTTPDRMAIIKTTGTPSCNGSSSTPCQVAEVTSASSLLSPKLLPLSPLVVKQEAVSTASGIGSSMIASVDDKKEVAFMPSGASTTVSSSVEATLTRPICQQQQQRLKEMKIPSSNVPLPPIMHRSLQSPTNIDLSSTMGAAVYTGNMTCDDRSANLMTTWPNQAHNPTLWQYSASIDYHPPFPPVGFQLVRDPITGHFLLIPASNIEALQRAILWPSYQPTPPQMIIPPISVQPSTPHLLLDTNVPAVDFITPETIHHNSSQHRLLITTDNTSKRKMTAPTLIKLEASDCSNAVVVTTCESNSIYTKPQTTSFTSAVDQTFYTPKTSGPVENGRRSQATSPVPCLPPIIENQSNQSNPVDTQVESCHLKTTTTVTLQDASNQTDMPLQVEHKGSQLLVPCRDKFEPYTKITDQNFRMPKKQDVATETNFPTEAEDNKERVLKEIQKRNEVQGSLNIQISNVPDVNIKKEIVSPLQVDLSGLELLSNSIEQFVVCETKGKKEESENEETEMDCEPGDERKDLSNDACEGAVLLQNLKNGFREIEKEEPYESENLTSLNGLGLLCALAEQRFQEEIGEETSNDVKLESDSEEAEEQEEELKKENEESAVKESDINLTHDKIHAKDCDLNSNYQNESANMVNLKIENDAINNYSDESSESLLPKNSINCKDEDLDKNEENDLTEFDEDSLGSESNSMKKGPGRPKRSKSVKIMDSSPKHLPSRNAYRRSKEMSPPILEKETDFSYNEENSDDSFKSIKVDILKPPTLIPNTIIKPVSEPEVEPSPSEVGFEDESDDLSKADEKKDESDSVDCEVRKRKSSDTDSQSSSSKKRKVGRPKKHFLLSGSQNQLTETIVAKKPKAKSSYLLKPTKSTESLKQVKEEMPVEKCSSKHDLRKNYAKIEEEATTIDTGNNLESCDKKCKKIRPKLKAEPKLREWSPLLDDDSIDWGNTLKKSENSKQKIQKKISVDEIKEEETESVSRPQHNSRRNNKEPKLQNCVLTTEDLKSDKFPIRTLTTMGGLFYAGQLSAIRAPDVYGITIDGERGNRPHIYSREEILKDSILEVKPKKAGDLPPGTRCCAYWSEQYRCLYPGTVSVPSSPDPELDDKFVNVEFDDGDSGKINIDDVRLLPEGYPIVEYDPNPLQSLSKRKRRISSASVESHSKERKSIDSLPPPEKNENVTDKVSTKTETVNEENESEKIIQMYEPGTFLSLECERRHLKKKRREKLKRLQSLSIDGKKKHKKHRCSDEHRHHRHHKKHRKHKHKHGKRHDDDSKDETKRREEKVDEKPDKTKADPILKKKKKNKCKSVENSCKLSDKSKTIKPKKCKERTDSVENRSKMAAFLPARQLWGWSGKGYKRPGAKGRARKEFYKTIQRGKERITVGDCAVFLSTGRPDRPYIGRIESMWESWGTNMIVRVKWFYHPEETVGCPATLEYPGALFESPHVDENDVQTISHKCEVLPLKEYTTKIGNEPHRYETIYDNNDIYYLAGYYDPTNTTLKMEPGVK